MKTTQLLTVAACLLVPLAVPANDIEPGQGFQSATQAAKPIVLDGNLSEWSGQPIVSPQFAIPKGSGAAAGQLVAVGQAGGQAADEAGQGAGFADLVGAELPRQPHLVGVAGRGDDHAGRRQVAERGDRQQAEGAGTEDDDGVALADRVAERHLYLLRPRLERPVDRHVSLDHRALAFLYRTISRGNFLVPKIR